MPLQAVCIGPSVDMLAAVQGEVHSVFARAANLTIGSRLWTLLGRAQGDLPCGIRLGLKTLEALRLHRGEPVHIRAGYMSFSARTPPLVVDCRAVPRWSPAAVGPLAPGLKDRLAFLSNRARPRAWQDSAAMAAAVMDCLRHDPARLEPVLATVIGSGPGLTPAGDDVLVGILAVLSTPAAGPAGAAAATAIAATLLSLLPATTSVSGHLLEQAAGGLFARPVADLISALIGRNVGAALHAAIKRVMAIGATSGADICMGILAGCESLLVKDDMQEAA